MPELTSLTVRQLSDGLATRAFSAVDVAEAYLRRIGALDPQVNAFVTVDEDVVRAQAREAQTRLDQGEATTWTGIPVAVKDNISTAGIETTCSSRILKGYVPPFDATVVEAMRRAGAITLGKTNLDEFAMGASTETSAYGPSRNPWDLARTPGGSSGGSAAAVAGQLAPVALGSDTGGSIRQPAALCGVVGFKPTYGRCSRYGLIAFASSLDQIGPISRTVEDAALLAELTTGHDPLDSTSLQAPPVRVPDLRAGSLRGVRIAVPTEMLSEGIESGVRDTIQENIDTLRKEGALIDEVSVPTIRYGVTTYYIIAPAEASSNLARFDGIRYGFRGEGKGHVGLVESTRGQGFGHEVKARIMIGTYALSAGYYDAFYVRAQQVRSIMRDEFNRVFQDYDLVLSPTSPVVAFPIGSVDDPLVMKQMDYCTIPANMGGFPAISLPGGLSDGLPVGLQLMGPAMGDERLLQLAYAVEQALGGPVALPAL